MSPPQTAQDLPRDIWRSIVLRSLQAEGSAVLHWLHLSLVCKGWRALLQGHPANVVLRGEAPADSPSPHPDEDWLRVTSVPLSSIAFDASQEFAGQLLFDEATLRSSVTSLRELASLRVPALLGGPAFSLTRFSRLRRLNLVHSNEGPALARALERLPRSLRELTLTSLDGLRTGVPLGMQLQGLTHVTSLTLSSRWGYACRDYDQYLASLPPSLRLVSLEGASAFVPSFRIRQPLPLGATLRIAATHIGCRLGRCVEHMSAGGQLAPGFSALRLEFESLTIADHLRRRAPAHGLRTDPGFGLGLRTAASEGDGWEEHMAPTAAAGLLALIQEAVGLEEVAIRLPRRAQSSADQLQRSLRLSYQHNDARRNVDGPLQRDVYATVGHLHDAMEGPAAESGVTVELVEGGNCLIIRRQCLEVLADACAP